MKINKKQFPPKLIDQNHCLGEIWGNIKKMSLIDIFVQKPCLGEIGEKTPTS